MLNTTVCVRTTYIPNLSSGTSKIIDFGRMNFPKNMPTSMMYNEFGDVFKETNYDHCACLSHGKMPAASFLREGQGKIYFNKIKTQNLL